jgi:hypothetical protein
MGKALPTAGQDGKKMGEDLGVDALGVRGSFDNWNRVLYPRAQTDPRDKGADQGRQAVMGFRVNSTKT